MQQATHAASHPRMLTPAPSCPTTQVWDLSSGACVQTLTAAHEKPIMKLGVFDNFLLSSSLDGYVKIWAAGSTPGVVVQPEPTFAYLPKEEEQKHYRGRVGGWQGCEVLMLCSCGDVRLSSTMDGWTSLLAQWMVVPCRLRGWPPPAACVDQARRMLASWRHLPCAC